MSNNTVYKNIAIIGSSGAIGQALLTHLAATFPDACIHAFSRKPANNSVDKEQGQPCSLQLYCMDYHDEASISEAAQLAAQDKPLDLVLVTTGLLHDELVSPEKSLRDLSAEKFQHVFTANTITPALVAKHFLPKLALKQHAVFAALSARVGSISDNHLSGWYSYRASKAALNMVIKNAAIGTARRNKQAIVVGLHPGTVDSALSQPFQSRVPEGKLFTPKYCAERLHHVINTLAPHDSGKCFAWDGQEIEP